ncbi:MAG TPA: hypothetical protein VFS43_03435 [Polyangiaceae bacterium]|nr:hypothetical protein [Polyangiaceae bacterium]
MRTALPVYFLWFTPEMLRGDRSLEPVSNLLGVVIVRGPGRLRTRLVLRRRPGPRDATSGTWTDQYGRPLAAPFDSGQA